MASNEPIKTHPCGREVCDDHAAGKREYRARALAMRTRQHELCGICGQWMSIEATTFDHQDGRGAGKRDDRIIKDGLRYNAAVHLLCNGARGSRHMLYVVQ